MAPDAEIKIELALIFQRAPWGQDTIALANAADHIQELYDDKVFDCGNLFPLQIEENHNSFEPSISPNPSDGRYTIQSFKMVNWSVYDTQGRLVKSGSSPLLDITEQPDGLYLVDIRGEKHHTNLKIIKH